MSRLQVLVAAMGQQDFSLGEKMNLRCDAVLANQADHYELASQKTPHGTWQMITTSTRGVGINRNLALLAAEGELLLLADDDMCYRDDMPEQVVAAFDENPKADVLIFGMDILKGGQIAEKRRLKKKRLHVWNAMRFGSCVIALRRSALLRENISFHRLFGGGCIYGSGEDSIFLKTCFDRGLKVYSHSYVLGTCCKDSSSWFTGYNEKYFYDKGALMGRLFPKMPRLMALYFSLRFKKKTEISPLRRFRLMLAGVKGGRKLLPYEEGL